MLFKKLRRKLAARVAGEQPMLSLPNVDGAQLRVGNWEGMSDESLVATMRYGLAAMANIVWRRAKEKNVPLSVMVTSDAAMSLIRHARECNATTLTVSQTGTIAGEDVGPWRIQITKLPDNYEFGEPGIQEEVFDEDGKLTRLSYSIRMGDQ